MAPGEQRGEGGIDGLGLTDDRAPHSVLDAPVRIAKGLGGISGHGGQVVGSIGCAGHGRRSAEREDSLDANQG